MVSANTSVRALTSVRSITGPRALNGPDIVTPPPDPTPGAPFQNVVYPTTIDVGELYEVLFDLNSTLQATATHPFLPYAASYPGLTGVTGITVEGEFTQDGFSSVTPQPAFYSELMQAEVDGASIAQKGGIDWILPSGTFTWRVRFVAHFAGTWQFRLKVTTASGTQTGDTYTFTAAANPAYKGMVRVSPTDARYLEFAGTGEYFPAIGVNSGSADIDTLSPSENAAAMTDYAANGMTLIRHWFTQWGAYGSVWGHWWQPSRPASNESQIGVMVPSFGAFAASYPSVTPPAVPRGGYSYLWLCSDERVFPATSSEATPQYRYIPGVTAGLNNVKIPVERSTSYRVRLRYNVQALEGPRVGGQPYGLVVKEITTQSEIWHPSTVSSRHNYPGIGTVRAASYSGATWTNTADPDYPGWTIMSGTWTSGASQDHISFLSIVLENCLNTSGAGADGTLNAGHAFVDQIWIEEDLGGGLYGPNLVVKSDFETELAVTDRQAYGMDVTLAAAKAAGVWMRFVVNEKNDAIWTLLNDDGTTYTGTTSNATGFYGNGREGGAATTVQRCLQRAWWRYCQARWGYSTAVAIWEDCNEGADSTAHRTHADEFIRYMTFEVLGLADGDESQIFRTHPGSLSYYGSAPQTAAAWDSATFPWIRDYGIVDFHQYVGPVSSGVQIEENARYFDSAYDIETLSANRGALTAGGFGKPVFRGEMGYGASGTTPDRLGDGSDDGVWLQIAQWVAAMHHGGIHFHYWSNAPWLLHYLKTTATTHDYRRHFDEVATFLADIPLNNGLYVDLGATVADSNVRVVGQKDTTHQRAHFVAINRHHTWASYVASQAISLPSGNPITWDSSSMSGNVTIPGMQAGVTYDVTITQYGRDTVQIASATSQIVANGSGQIVTSLSGLNANTALATYKIMPGTPTSLTVPAVNGWQMAGANVARTSYVADAAPGDLNEIWATPIEPYVSQIAQAIGVTVGANKRIMVSTANGLMCFNALTGALAWHYKTLMPLGHAPTFHNDIVYVGGTDRKLHAVDAATGAGLWTFTTGGPVMTNPLVLELGSDPLVYFGSRDGKVYCVWGDGAALEGTEKWSYQCGGQVNYSPAYDETSGYLYTAAMDGRAYALDALTGQSIWTSAILPGQGFMNFWPVVHPDGTVILTRRSERNTEFSEATTWLFPAYASTAAGAAPGPTDVDNNIVAVTISGSPSGGTFTTTVDGQTTTGVAYNASAATLQTALEALSNVAPGDITVSGSAGGPYTLRSIAAFIVSASGASLTGGSSPAATAANQGSILSIRTGHLRFDVRTSSIGSTIPAYHANYSYKRRTLFMLDTVTGTEQLFNIRGLGAIDPPPITHVGKTGNHYPPVVDAAGILYTRTTDQNSQNVIAGAVPVGWHPDTPEYLLLPVSAFSAGASARMPHDEPCGLSLAGTYLYMNYNTDRLLGSVNLANDNPGYPTMDAARQWRFMQDGLPPAISTTGPKTTATPGTSSASTDYWHEMDKFRWHPTSLSAGIQNWHLEHGDQVGPTIYDGKMYVIRSNALLCFDQVAAGPSTGTNAPVGTSAPIVTSGALAGTSLDGTTLTTLLEAQITLITNETSVRAGWYGVGAFWDNTGDTYEVDIGDLWHNPGWDNLRVLLRARPFVNSTLQAAIDSFIAREYKPVATAGRASAISYRHLGYAVGTSRDGYDLSTGQQTFGLQGGPNSEPQGFYGVYKWAQQYGSALAAYNALRVLTVTAPATSLWLTHKHAGYLAYIYAYVGDGTSQGLMQMAGVSSDSKSAALIADRTTYQNLKLSMDPDQLWTGAQTSASVQSYRVNYGAWPFMYLTPELASFLRTNDLSHIQSMVDEFTAAHPYWHIAHNAEVQGENASSLYVQAHSLFQARAQILQESRATLTKYLDTPICRLGDMYYIDNLCACLEAS